MSTSYRYTRAKQMRRFVPPLGWPLRIRCSVVQPADRPPLVGLNRFPRQVIGFGIRLPDGAGPPHGHFALSITWAKAARWWL